ncbi:GAF domain-containing protein [Streptomyces atriruber]|uniref:GAF domain-containing protein n=1 Tax=Streptomyces atriruber TaxID=545121 RepID=UPI0006E39115|nr:GAF domain-containing protein [Streptomyces atriruber]
MMHDPTGRLLLTPVDKEAPARVRRLRGLGIGQYSEPAFDAFADRLAELTGAPYAMVNFLDEKQQFFAGLHTPGNRDGEACRYLARDHGYCPHVVVRRKALVLEDVRDYPRFAGNPVVDETGIRSYLGAPLIDRTATVLGTVSVVDVEPRRWGTAGLDTIKRMAAELVEQIHRREAGGI